MGRFKPVDSARLARPRSRCLPPARKFARDYGFTSARSTGPSPGTALLGLVGSCFREGSTWPWAPMVSEYRRGLGRFEERLRLVSGSPAVCADGADAVRVAANRDHV